MTHPPLRGRIIWQDPVPPTRYHTAQWARKSELEPYQTLIQGQINEIARRAQVPTLLIRREGRGPQPLAHFTTPKEVPVTQPHVPQLPPFPQGVFQEFVDNLNIQIRKSRQTPEEEFRDLDVQVGDRVRLTAVKTTSTINWGGQIAKSRQVEKDAAVLEGTIIGLKVRGGNSQIRVSGFGHTGPSTAGGQHVWFAVEDYKVEVLHKVYRLTDEDRLYAEVAAIGDTAWSTISDAQRESYRQRLAPRVERIKKILQG